MTLIIQMKKDCATDGAFSTETGLERGWSRWADLPILRNALSARKQ